MNIEQIRKQAQDENISSEILAQLATNKDRVTRQYVASNPNTPLEIIKKLSQEFPEEVISNLTFDLLLIEEPDNDWVQLTLARSSTTPIETLVELSKSDDYGIRAAVAGNLTTPLSVLDELSARINNEPFPARVFTAVAKNPNTTAQILDKLIQAGGGKCIPVLDAVLNNPKVSLATLKRLANQPNISIKHSVFKHPKVTENFVRNLSFSPHANVRKAVAEHPKTDYSTILMLAKDKFDKVRCTIAERQDITPGTIRILVRDSSENVRGKIAERQDITPRTIEILARDSSENVREKIAKRQYLSPKIISNLARDSHQSVRYQIAYHQNATPETVEILARDSSKKVRCRIANHLNMTEDIAKMLAYDSCEEVRCKIAQSKPKLTNIVHILGQDSSEAVRCEIANHKNIREDIADKLAHDSCERVRHQIAGNRFISEHTANKLARDSSAYVRRQLVNHRYFYGSSKYRHSKPVINQNVSARTLEILLEKSDENNYPQLPHDANISDPRYKKDYPISAIYDLETRIDIARHPQATFDILDRLKSSRYDCVRQAVASNENNYYPEIIKCLTEDSCENVRHQIARRTDIPEKIARLLANDNSEYVRLGLAINRSTPATILQIVFDNSYDAKSARFAANTDLKPRRNRLAPYGYELAIRWEIVNHPQVTFKIINRLKSDRYDCIRQAVARNIRTSKTILDELKNDPIAIVRQAVACNSNTSIDTLIELSNSCDRNIADRAKSSLAKYQQLIQQAQDENTPSEVLTQLANNYSKTIRQYVASNPNTPIEILGKLSQSFSNEITTNPIFNLLLLENSESNFVKLALARSSTTDSKTLSRLIDFERISIEDLKVLYAVAKNSNTSIADLEKLLNWHPDRNLIKSYGIATSTIQDNLAYNISLNNSTPCHLLKQLAKKNSQVIHDCVPNTTKIYPNSSRNINELQKTLKFKTLQAISSHQNAPSDLLEYLAGENCKIIQQNILNHPNVSQKAIDIVEFIQNKPTQSDRSIAEQLAKDSRAEVRKIVAQNENISPAILADLAADSNMQVVLTVAQNRQTTSDSLEKLATILNKEIHQAIARHHNTSPKVKYIMEFMKSIQPVKIPESILEELIDSDRLFVRMKLVQHEFTPAYILEKLTTDPDKYIRDMARQNLNANN